MRRPCYKPNSDPLGPLHRLGVLLSEVEPHRTMAALGPNQPWRSMCPMEPRGERGTWQAVQVGRELAELTMLA